MVSSLAGALPGPKWSSFFDAWAGGYTGAMAFALKEAPKGWSRAKFMREVARHHKKQDKAKLAQLKQQIAEVKDRRRHAMKRQVTKCRTRRLEVREQVKQFRAAERERINREVDKMRQDARKLCESRKDAIRSAARSEEQKRREVLKAERHLQRELKATERHAKFRQAAVKASARELSQESDDRVRANIDADMVPVFNRVKGSIKGSAHKSRTEAFLQWLQENPGEVVQLQQAQADRELKALLKEQAAAERAARARLRRKRPTKAELDEYLREVPF